MGASSSHHLAEDLHGLQSVKTLTDRDIIRGKNFQYYSGKRFTVIPPKYYTKYTPGYLWGFYESVE